MADIITTEDGFTTFRFRVDMSSDFAEEIKQRVKAHNEWFDNACRLISQKNGSEMPMEFSIKTPRHKKRKSVYVTAKKTSQRETAVKRKKKRMTGRVSVVDKETGDESATDQDPQENKSLISRCLKMSEDSSSSSPNPPPETKWKQKRYTRSSRAVFRETINSLAKQAPESTDTDASPVLPNRRVTRALRRTLLQKSQQVEELPVEAVSETSEQCNPLEEQPRVCIPSPIELKAVTVADNVAVTPKATCDRSLSEWMTDDESFHEAKTSPAKEVAVKQKRVHLKITRQSSQRVLRTQSQSTIRTTRAQSRIDSARTMVTRTMQKKIASGDDTSGSDSVCKTNGSSARSVRAVSRLRPGGSTVKKLTESAVKRREEDEQRRQLQLQKLQEREIKALEQKEKYITEKVSKNKQKREENVKRAAKLREQQEKEKEEKLKQEMEKKEENERRYREKEEKKKARLLARQQAVYAKQLEADQHRKLREEREKLEKLEEIRKKQEESAKKREADALRKREEMKQNRKNEERIAAMIQHHNNSLQKKAVATSYLKKTEQTNASALTGQHLDKTYTVDDETEAAATGIASYHLTPPPLTIKKPPNPENYDITDIRSDDDTDDERKPRKPIPNWAKGSQFIEALQQQFSKPLKEREREIAKIFPPVNLCVDLDDIFRGHKPVVSRYAKRTSSAVWDTSPVQFTSFSLNSTQAAEEMVLSE